MVDKESILKGAKMHGVDLSSGSNELVAKFAYCVSERLLAGDTLKKAVKHCIYPQGQKETRSEDCMPRKNTGTRSMLSLLPSTRTFLRQPDHESENKNINIVG